MNEYALRVAVCVECRGFAEPPLARLYDHRGRPTPFFVCLLCREAKLRPHEEPQTPGGGEPPSSLPPQ